MASAMSAITCLSRWRIRRIRSAPLMGFCGISPPVPETLVSFPLRSAALMFNFLASSSCQLDAADFLLRKFGTLTTSSGFHPDTSLYLIASGHIPIFREASANVTLCPSRYNLPGSGSKPRIWPSLHPLDNRLLIVEIGTPVSLDQFVMVSLLPFQVITGALFLLRHPGVMASSADKPSRILRLMVSCLRPVLVAQLVMVSVSPDDVVNVRGLGGMNVSRLHPDRVPGFKSIVRVLFG